MFEGVDAVSAVFGVNAVGEFVEKPEKRGGEESEEVEDRD